jgi:hypothetical protein
MTYEKYFNSSPISQVGIHFPLFFIILGCTLKENFYYAAPTLLPETERHMKTAGCRPACSTNEGKVICQTK